MALLETYALDIYRVAGAAQKELQQIYDDIYDFSRLSVLLKFAEQFAADVLKELQEYSEKQLLAPLFALFDVIRTMYELIYIDSKYGSPHLLPLFASALSRAIFARISARVEHLLPGARKVRDRSFNLLLQLFLQTQFGDMQTEAKTDAYAASKGYGYLYQKQEQDVRKADSTRQTASFYCLVGSGVFLDKFLDFFGIRPLLASNPALEAVVKLPECDVDVSQAYELRALICQAITSDLEEDLLMQHCRVCATNGRVCLPVVSRNFASLADIMEFLKDVRSQIAMQFKTVVAPASEEKTSNRPDKTIETLFSYFPADFPSVGTGVLSAPVLLNLTQRDAYNIFGKPVFAYNQFSQTSNYLFNYILYQYNNFDDFTPRQRDIIAQSQQLIAKRIGMPIPSPAALKTANAAPFVVSRYIQREAARAYYNQLKNTPHNQVIKLSKFVNSHYLTYVDKLTSNLYNRDLNSNILKMNDKQLMQELFLASEIPNFTDVFVLKDKQEANQFAVQIIQAYVGLSVNAAFMTFSAREVAISRITGIIQPLGGFSTLLLLSYLNMLISDFKQFEIVYFAFKQAYNAVLDLINAKDGAGHAAVNEIAQQRGIVIREQQRVWYCGKRAFRSFCLQLFNCHEIYQKNFYFRTFLGNLSVQAAASAKDQIGIYEKIPRILQAAFALSELLHFTPQSKLSDLCQGFQLSFSQLYILQVLSLSQGGGYRAYGSQDAQSAYSGKSSQGPANPASPSSRPEKEPLYWYTPQIGVISADAAGGTTLTAQLLYLPVKRYATIQETLLFEYYQYKSQLLIENSSDPWKFYTDDGTASLQARKAFQIVYADDDVVSVGSWLSMDSQSLQTKMQQESEQNEAAVHVLNQFLMKLRNVELTEKVDQMRQEKLNYSTVESVDFEYKVDRNYVDIMHTIPAQLFQNANQVNQVSHFRGNVIQVQKDRKYIPPLVFVDIKPAHTEFAVVRQINLLPFYNSINVNFYDVPLRMTGFGCSEVAEQEIARLNEMIAQNYADFDDAQVYIKQNQSTFYVLYYQLLMIYQKPKLPQVYLYPQMKLFSQLINQQKQLQRAVATYLQYLLRYQQSQCQQEVEKAQQTVSNYTSQFAALQQSGQVTYELEYRYYQSIQYFQKQIDMYNQISKYVAGEEQLLVQMLTSYDDLTTHAQRVQSAYQKLTILQAQRVRIIVTDQTKAAYRSLVGQMNLLLVVYDCTGGRSQLLSEEFCRFLAEQNKPVIFVCTKIDLFERHGCLYTIELNCEMATRFGFKHYFVSGESCQFVCELRAEILRQLCLYYKIDVENDLTLYKK